MMQHRHHDHHQQGAAVADGIAQLLAPDDQDAMHGRPPASARDPAPTSARKASSRSRWPVRRDQLGGGAAGHHPPLIDDTHGVAELLHLVHDMGGEDHALALVAHRADELDHGARSPSRPGPVVGSSKIITGGSWTTARAIATFCFMPVEKLSARRSANSSISSSRNSCVDAPWPPPAVHAVERGEVGHVLARREPPVEADVGGQHADAPAHPDRVAPDIVAGHAWRCRRWG